jgi:hypothetical protein
VRSRANEWRGATTRRRVRSDGSCAALLCAASEDLRGKFVPTGDAAAVRYREIALRSDESRHYKPRPSI